MRPNPKYNLKEWFFLILFNIGFKLFLLLVENAQQSQKCLAHRLCLLHAISYSVFNQFFILSENFAMSQFIKNVSDASFTEDVLNSDQPVLVDYWAAWCGPCKAIAPILDEIAEQYADRVTIAKLNVDENPETASKFGIRGIPTLMLFKNGEPTETKVGAVSKTQLQEFLDNSL